MYKTLGSIGDSLSGLDLAGTHLQMRFENSSVLDPKMFAPLFLKTETDSPFKVHIKQKRHTGSSYVAGLATQIPENVKVGGYHSIDRKASLPSLKAEVYVIH